MGSERRVAASSEGERTGRSRRPLLVVALAVCVFLVATGIALAATGDLTLNECFDNPGTIAACTDQDGLIQAGSVAVPVDGSSVYVASDQDVLVNFDRDTSGGATNGDLSFNECFDDPGTIAACTDQDGLNSPSVAVSADGSSVYVAGFADDALVNFDRDTSGGPTNGDLSFNECFDLSLIHI